MVSQRCLCLGIGVELQCAVVTIAGSSEMEDLLTGLADLMLSICANDNCRQYALLMQVRPADEPVGHGGVGTN